MKRLYNLFLFFLITVFFLLFSNNLSAQQKRIKNLPSNFQGFTLNGGSYECGIYFEFSLSLLQYFPNISLDTAHGVNACGTTANMNNGTVYGMTFYGGTHNDGVIFQVLPNNESYFKRYNLDSANGSHPHGSLILASDSMFYGMTMDGGANNLGVIFQFDPINIVYTKKIDLTLSGGCSPFGGLIQAGDGYIYGLTKSGGANNLGAIFQYDIVNNIYTKKIDLDSSTGSHPLGKMVQASNGHLYGMTKTGGANNLGVIFDYDPVNNIYTDKVDFADSIGANPYGSLLLASDGKLYGMTESGGTNNFGVIFQYDYLTNTYIDRYNLNISTGSGPWGSLIQIGNGMMYGMTSNGGYNYAGTIFSYDPIANIYTDIYDFVNGSGVFPIGNLIDESGIYTGIEEEKNSDKMTLFPVLNNGIFNIVYPSLKLKSELQLIDVAGRIVFRHELNNNETEQNINANELCNGMYFWEVVSDKGIEGKGKMTVLK